jgi:hypothetical protein
METTIGAVGRSWRATVTSWGAVQPWDGGPGLDWWIAADDRWHVPSEEPAVRQGLIEGAPVVETSVRVPSGDAVQRVYVVADRGGMTVIEVENRSSLPFAVAFSHGDLLSARPPTDVPVQGISLPASTVVFPVAHGSTIRVAMAHDGSGAGALPDSLPSAGQVARGWHAQVDRGTRVVLPEHGKEVMAARCALVLEGPRRGDPVELLIGVRELVRLGQDAKQWVEDVAAAVERLALSVRHRRLGWMEDASLVAAAEVLRAAGEVRGATDVDVVRARLHPGDVSGPHPQEQPPATSGVPLLAWIDAVVACDTTDGADLMPGLPRSWYGQSIEVYGRPVVAGRVSCAIRWHGSRPALLWEAWPAMHLTCSSLDTSWSSGEAKGETLLGPPLGSAT